MCHYITAVIGGTASLDRMNEIAARHHRWLTPIQNRWVTPHLQKNEVYYSTLPPKAMCDCGTYLGWAVRTESQDSKPGKIESEIAKLRRKGWSEAKIARWSQSKSQHDSSWQPPSEADLESSHRNHQWFSLTEDMLSEAGVDSFGLMVHWYRSGLENSIPFAGRVETRLSNAVLASMQDCTLYMFKSASPHKGS